MRIPAKMLLVVAVLWMSAVGLAVYAFEAFEDSRQLITSSNVERNRALAAQSARSAVLTSTYWTRRMLEATDRNEQAEYESSAINALNSIDRHLNRLHVVGEDDRTARNEDLARMVEELRARIGYAIAHARSGAGTDTGIDGASTAMVDVQGLLSSLESLSNQMLVSADQNAAKSEDRQKETKGVVVVILVAGFGLSFFIAVLISLFGLVRPIQDVTKVMNRLVAGDTAVELRPVTGRTEVDDLWRTARAFKGTLERLKAESALILASRRQLEEIARRDPLTGLGNRDQFQAEMRRFSAIARERRCGFGLLLIDLDRFKLVNDTLGHSAGDHLLVEVARRLSEGGGPDSAALRLGGDEFALILFAADAAALDDRAGRIADGLRQPVVFAGHVLDPSFSIGGAVFPDHADDAAALILFADRCLYLAKMGPAKIRIFDPVMKSEIEFAQSLLGEIAPAIETGQFVVHYQPQVTSGTHAHAGFEALVRWQHPRHGLLPPSRFLPLAERASAMVGLTTCVLETVARDIKAWRSAGLPCGRVAVNVPEDIVGADFGTAFLQRIVETHGIEWSDFTVEVTEDVFLHRNADQILANLKAMSDNGTKVSLDDFGTGFASLVHLRQIPMDEIKIDRSFTADLGRDPRADDIVHMVLDLARRLGKTVVAEGVETPEQAAFLLAGGCQVLQGYLFARPMPVADATAWLASRLPAPAPDPAFPAGAGPVPMRA